MKIDLHTHSDHSFDSRLKVKSLVRLAEENGLDAIAITDHDTMSAYGPACKAAGKITIIPAMEITADGGTHIIGLFLKDEIFARDIFEVIEEIHRQGGLVMLPHPCRPRTGLIHNREKKQAYNGEEMSKIMSQVDLIETVNFHDDPENVVSADRWSAMHPDIPRTAGSDTHAESDIGKAYVELEDVKSNSLDDIKMALLYSARVIRYEAYTHDAGWVEKTGRSEGKKRTLIIRTSNLIPSSIKNSIRRIYRRSAGKLISGRLRGISDKTEMHDLKK